MEPVYGQAHQGGAQTFFQKNVDELSRMAKNHVRNAEADSPGIRQPDSKSENICKLLLTQATERVGCPSRRKQRSRQQRGSFAQTGKSASGHNSGANSASGEVSSLTVWFSSRPSPPQAARESDSKRSIQQKLNCALHVSSLNQKLKSRVPAGQTAGQNGQRLRLAAAAQLSTESLILAQNERWRRG